MQGKPTPASQIPPFKSCEVCGSSFIRGERQSLDRYLKRRTCSVDCWRALHIKVRQQNGNCAPNILLKCDKCQKEFWINASDAVSAFGYRKRFCSKECADANRRGVSLPIEETTKIKFICEHCGKERFVFPSFFTYNRMRFCSVRCRELARQTPLETRIYFALDSSRWRYERQYPIWRYLADAYVPDLNAVVECYGDYDHCNPTKYPNGPTDSRQQRAIEHDQKRETRLKNAGYRVVVFWSSELKCMDDQEIIRKIAEH